MGTPYTFPPHNNEIDPTAELIIKPIDIYETLRLHAVFPSEYELLLCYIN